MTEILQIFSGNPFSTFIGKRVEAATRPELESDDWAINLEICDLINENDDDAKDAVRAIKKRLQQIEQDRDFAVTNRTLTVLETCVSNCSRRFHVLVMTKDFIQDLVKLIGPKNNPPIDLQERVLSLIERWADAFKSQPDLSGVVTVYNDLRAKGVTFPPRDRVPNVPIQTPQRSIPATTQSNSPSQAVRSNVNQDTISQPIGPPQMQLSGPVVLEGEGYNKISQDLAVVQSSIDMFNEIIQLLETKNEEPDWKLAQDLNTTCRQMKNRIVDLIERVANEDLTIEFLRLNDDLNNIFVKYDRLMKNRSKLSRRSSDITAAAGSGSSQADLATLAQPTTQRSSPRVENELSLIDFNADDSSGATRQDQPAPIDSFDTSAITSNRPAASSSQPTQQPKQSRAPLGPLADQLSQLGISGSNTASSGNKKATGGLPEEISSVREQDFAEIENWLSTDTGRDLASISADMPSLEPISIPNAEFENFIATRALAGFSARQQPTASPTPKQNQKQPEPSV